jgi:hypothetical protein
MFTGHEAIEEVMKPYTYEGTASAEELLCDRIHRHDSIIAVHKEDGFRDRFHEEGRVLSRGGPGLRGG